MIDHANELRRYSRKIGHPAGDVPSVMLAAAEEIELLAARLEAAEKEREELHALITTIKKQAHSEYVLRVKKEEECTRLRAKVEAAENDAAHQKALAESALRVAEGWERKCGELRAALQHEADCVEACKSEIEALRAKIEAAEKERDDVAQQLVQSEQGKRKSSEECDALRNEIAFVKEVEFPRKAQAVADAWRGKCKRLEAERDALRAKIEQMDKQEPVAWLHETRRDSDVVTDAVKHVWGKVAVGSMAAYSIPLYTLPGAQPSPSVPDSWPVYADPFAYVIQHLNSNPYPLTKDETIAFIKELRALYNAGPEAKP